MIKIVKYFEPSSEDNRNIENDEKIALMLISFITTMFQSIYTYSMGLKIDALILLSGTILGFSALLFYKGKIISNKSMFHIQTFLICIYLIAVNIDAGMISSPSMIWLGAFPIFAIVYTGLFWGLIWSITSIIISMIIHFLYQKQIITFNEFNYQQATNISFSNLMTGPMLFYMVFGYYYNKKKEEHNINKPLIDMGKSTSFLLHEISKPISRIKTLKKDEDIEQLVSLLEIANTFYKKQKNITTEKISINLILQESIDSFKPFIDYYNLNILVNTKADIVTLTNCKLLKIALDNLIKNAIENNITHNSKENIYIDIYEDKFIIQNKLFNKSLEKEQLLKPGFTTKPNHMGMGVTIIENILKNLNLTYRIDINKTEETFTQTVIFSQ